ncbi:MAG: metallophosphoesterase family protein [Bacteroidales bacterium]|nr:metallophosphoesterase family protein [Bacteroidales bacterium]
MKRIGLLSDTHNCLIPEILKFFENCDEIWHAGDLGSIQIAEELNKLKPLKAVYGNIDGGEVRIIYPETLILDCENVKVVMTHIGGYPGNYEKKSKSIIIKEKPKLFISGHSHILKVIYDKKYELLHLNPGAAGKSGFHNVSTAMRFEISGDKILNLEIFETSKNKLKNPV